MNDEILDLNTRANAALLRMENALIKEIIDAYTQAMSDLQTSIAERVNSIDPNDTAALRRLSSDATLLNLINQRLDQLKTVVADLIRTAVETCATDAITLITDQVNILMEGIGLPAVTTSGALAINTGLESVIESAVGQVDEWGDALTATMRQTLRSQLAQGRGMTEIARALFQKSASAQQQPSAFRKGRTGAELFARRVVIEVDNSARQATMEQYKQNVPKLQKQLIAVVQSRTTDLCLKVHGQIRDIDKPYDLPNGTPKPFNRKMMHPPFHWNCRSSSVPYHRDFEDAGTTTSELEAAARAELNGR